MGRRIIFLILLTIQTVIHASNPFIENIKGKVMDSDGDPVMFANVNIGFISILDSVRNTKYYDTNTDVEGEFRLPLALSCDSISISIQSMGHQSFNNTYPASIADSTINVTIQISGHELAEVIVKGRFFGISEKGDTTKFVTSHFVNGSEQTINEVIQKMPGFEVDTNGKVSYQGKSLDKVLVNGKDVFSNAGEYINNLPADFASQIEVIDNYNLNEIESGFRSNSVSALNLKTQSNARWNGRLGASGGIKSRFSTNNSVIGMLKEHSISTIFNANNVGEPLFSIIDYINTQNLSESLSSKNINNINLSSDEQRLLLPPDNEYYRSGLLGCINYSYYRNRKYHLKANAIYHHANVKAEDAVSQDFFNGIFNQLSDKKQNCNDFFLSTLTSHWNYSNIGSLHAKTHYSLGDYRSDNYTENYIKNLQIKETEGVYDSRPIKLSQEISINHRVGNGILFLDLEGEFRYSRNRKYLFALNSKDHTYAQELSIMDKEFNNLSLKNTYLKGDIGYIVPLPQNNLNLKFETHYEWQNDGLLSNYCEKIVNERISFSRLYGYAGLFKNNGFVRFDIGFKLGHLNIIPNGFDELKEHQQLIFSPNANFELIFKKNNRLMISTRYYEIPVDILYISRAQNILGNSSISVGSSISNMLKKSLDVKISYRYISLFNRLTLFSFATYIKSWNDVLVSSLNEGIQSYIFYRDQGKKDIFMSQLYVSKGILDLPLTIKLVPRLNITSTKVGNSLGITSIKNETISTQVVVETNFRQSCLNFEAEGYYSSDMQRIGNPFIKKRHNTWRTALKSVIRPFKPLSFVISGKWESFQVATENMSRFDFDVDFSYKIKSVMFGVKGENILHLNKNEWLSESTSSDMYSITKYRKIPGYIMAYLKYSF